MMTEWMGGRNDKPRPLLPMYARPGGLAEPRIVAGLQEQYLIGSSEEIEGAYTVVGQISALLNGNDTLSTIRIVRNVPPTQRKPKDQRSAHSFCRAR